MKTKVLKSKVLKGVRNWKGLTMNQKKKWPKNIKRKKRENMKVRVSVFNPEIICSGDLKSGHVWILNGQSFFGFRMVHILNGSFSLDCFLIKKKLFMLTLQSSKSQIVCSLIFKVNQDSQGDVILLNS